MFLCGLEQMIDDVKIRTDIYKQVMVSVIFLKERIL